MFKNLSIQIKLQIIVFFTILAVTMIVSFQAIYTMNKISMEEVQSFKKETYTAKEKELQNYIDIAYKTLEAFHKKIDDEGLEGADVTIVKQEAIKAIQNIKFGENGYFWINTLDGYMVANPAKASLNGKNILEIKTTDGHFLFKEMIELVNKSNEGIYKYHWKEDNNSKSKIKYSYVKKFEQWGWMIGTGVYVDKIEKHIKEMKNETETETENFIMTLVICSVLTILVLNFLLFLVTRKIIAQPLVNFEIGLLGFFKYLNREQTDVKELEIKSHDEIGIMAKVVNDNIKITKTSVEEDRALIDETISVLGEFEQGDLCQRLNMEVSNPALNELKNVLNKMGANMEHNIDNVLKVLEQYTHYNYLDKIDQKGLKEHLLRLATGVNDLGDSITHLLVENKSNGLTLDDTSDILVENMEQLNKASTEAAASLEETAAALEEMTGNIRSNTQNVVKMANFANEITISSKEGEKLASQTTQSMQEINDQVTAINEAIAVIDQIAFQTNILSLNAAVEAATAGEAGKGFAVVAQEVRNLASRSAEAAKEIKDIVEIATSKANEGKEIAQNMIEGYSSLNENIVKTTDLIKDVETGSKEQQSGIEQINDAINQLDQQTQANVSIANSTQVVAEETDFLAKLVVSNANEKEFHGKDEVKAKKMNLDSKKNVKTESQVLQKQIKEEKNTITSNNTSSESEWESF